MLYIYIRLYIFCFFLYLLPLVFISHRLFLPVSLCPFRTHSQTYLYIHCQRLFHDCASLFSFCLCPSQKGSTRSMCMCVCSFCACMCFLIVQALNSVLPHFTLAAAQPQLIFRPALRPYELSFARSFYLYSYISFS